jgi:hypothetical protein
MPTTTGSHPVATFTAPVNNTSPIDANTVRNNDNSLRSAYVNHDADTGIHVQSSDLSSRPVASIAGRKWMTIDGSDLRLWIDTGSTWVEVAAAKLSSAQTFALTGDVTGSVSSNLSSGASIATTLADNTVTSAKIVDGTIVNADVSANAEIAVSKLADGAARQVLQTDAAGTGVEWTSNVDVPGTLDVTGATTLDAGLAVDGTTLVVDATNDRVGIGTTSPATTLDISGAENALQSRFGSIAGRGLEISTQVVLGTTDAGSVLNAKGAAAGTLIFQTESVERARIDASGNVGIGTASPGAQLHVVGASSASANQILQGDAGSATAFWVSAKANSTLHIGGNGGTEPATGALVIYANGELGSLGVYNATVGGTNRDVFVDNIGIIGYVSSIRASKMDIAPVEDTDWLLQLEPVSFHYRKKDADGAYTDEPDGAKEYGLIAEDVESVKPELCFYDIVDGEPELRGISYSKLVTPLLALVKQQQARLDALEARLAALES